MSQYNKKVKKYQNYKEINGDLIELAKEGRFDVIVHGCNCQCIQGAGIAPQMVRAFQTDKFPMEADEYKGDVNKLGTIDSLPISIDSGKVLNVVNAYTQVYPGATFGASSGFMEQIPLDYAALSLCLKKINHEFKGMTVGLPKIGCGLAGGDWDMVSSIIRTYMPDVKVFVVNYKPKKNKDDRN